MAFVQERDKKEHVAATAANKYNFFIFDFCLLSREIKCFCAKSGKQGMKFYRIALFLLFILVFVRKFNTFVLLSEAQQALLRSNLRGIR